MQTNSLPSDSSEQPDPSCPPWEPLDEAAAVAGVAPENLLLATTAVLSGIAGPGALWNSSLRWEFLEAVSMILPAGSLRLRQYFRRLLDIPRNLQNLLRKRSSQFLLDTLQQVRYGVTGNCKTQGAAVLSVSAYQSYQQALIVDGDPSRLLMESSLKHDLTYAPSQIREEALLRPTFIVDSTNPAELQAALLECHFRAGLVLGVAENLIPSKPIRGTTPLADLLEGMEVRTPRGKGLETAGHLVHVKASAAVMTASTAQLGTLTEKAPACLSHFILPGNDGRIAAPESNDLASTWDGCYRAAVRKIVDLRRQGDDISRRIRDDAKAQIFEQDRRNFLAELEELEDPERYLAFTNLPTAIAWTLGTLCDCNDYDDTVLRIAVPVARLLLHRHREQLQRITDTHTNRDQPQREHKMVDRVRRLAPVTDRDLVRGFDCQKMEEHRPVIERLLKEGLLARDPEGKLILGDAGDTSVARTAQTAPGP